MLLLVLEFSSTLIWCLPMCSSHLSFRPEPVLHLGDETLGGYFAPDKHVIKDSIDTKNDPLDSYFGF